MNEPCVASINFVNEIAASIPSSGVNTVALRTFDPWPFAAATAANLIATQVTTPGPGVFI